MTTILIENISNIKEILQKTLTILKTKKINTIIWNPPYDGVQEYGGVIQYGGTQENKHIKVEIENLTVTLSKTVLGGYNIELDYQKERVNIHTQDKEINEELKKIKEEFLNKCK